MNFSSPPRLLGSFRRLSLNNNNGAAHQEEEGEEEKDKHNDDTSPNKNNNNKSFLSNISPSTSKSNRKSLNGSSNNNNISGMDEFVHPPEHVVYNNIPSYFFSTPIEHFNAYDAALKGLDDITIIDTLQTNIIQRMEELDLMRDAVNTNLAVEVRKSSEGLVDSIRKINDVDVEITKTLIVTKNARRKIRDVKQNYQNNELKIAGLLREKKQCDELKKMCGYLQEAENRRQELFFSNLDIELKVKRTKDTLGWINQVNRETNQAVRALVSFHAKVSDLPFLLMDELRVAMRELLCAPPSELESHAAKYQTLFESFRFLLEMVQQVVPAATDISKAEKEDWFLFVIDTCCKSVEFAFSCNLGLIKSIFLAYLQMVEREKQNNYFSLLNENKKIVWKCFEDNLSLLLKSQEARELTIVDFSSLITNCEALVASNEFFLDEKHLALPILAMIRNRGKLFAQQYQAEGFEMIRVYWLREKFDVLNLSVGEINKKLNLMVPNEAEEEIELAKQVCAFLSPFDKKEEFVFVTIIANGYVKQISRTMEILSVLPQLSGEAFRGMLRCFEFYLFELMNKFMIGKIKITETLKVFYRKIRENLKEWIFQEKEEQQQQPQTASEKHAIGWMSLYIASESLNSFLYLMNLTKKTFQKILPVVERTQLMDEMYTVLPGAIREIKRDLCFRAFSFLKVEVFSVNEEIASINWPALSSVNVKANKYVSSILADVKRIFQEKIKGFFQPAVLVPFGLYKVWTDFVCHVFDLLLDVYSQNIKECSFEGRTCLSFDVATLSSGFFDISPYNKQACKKIEEWIKAFYLEDEKELVAWVEAKRGLLSGGQIASILEFGLFSQKNPTNKKRAKELIKTMIG